MKIVLTDHGFPSIDQERALFAAAGHELVVAQCKTPAELIPLCRDADALLVQWATISRELIATLDRCKVIVRYGIGVDSVDRATWLLRVHRDDECQPSGLSAGLVHGVTAGV